MKCERKKARYQYRKSKCKKFTTKDRKCIITRGKLSEKKWSVFQFLKNSCTCREISMQRRLLPLPLVPHVPPCWPGIRPYTSSSAWRREDASTLSSLYCGFILFLFWSHKPLHKERPYMFTEGWRWCITKCIILLCEWWNISFFLILL